MPNISEEPLEVEIGLLEAGPPTPGSYPYPSLSATGSSQKVSFRVVVLENDFIRATFVPALGGRLLSLFDKRNGVETLSSGPLIPSSGGRRGAVLHAGVELHLDGFERLTSLAAVQYAAEEPDEDRPAGLWMSEAVTGTGLSWHLHVTLPEDRAELVLEARVFNRTFGDVPYSGGLLLPAVGENGASSGVALIPHRGRWHRSAGDGLLRVSRFAGTRMLAPRQLDTWSCSIIPISGLSGVSAASRAGALQVDGEKLRIQASGDLRQHKVVLRTATGETLEAPVEVLATEVLEMALPGPVTGVAVMDAARNVVLRWEADRTDGTDGTDRTDRADRADRTDRADRMDRSYATDSEEELEEATFDVASRHVAHSLLGVRALAVGDFDEAETRFEQALLYNAEDHLTWWFKSMANRLREASGEESEELLNAHYLAPLDPALRAESFLAQPQTMEREGSPLLKPMAEYPESFIEVAALLVEARLFEQASRWIDEALRHCDLPMLRYLLAYSHLESTGLDLEAAQLVGAAAKQPVGPPYPWRPVEIEALRVLADRFPGDARIGEWRGLGR